MKTRITITGVEALARRLRQYPDRLGKSVEQIVKMEARALCEEYAKSTGPGVGLNNNVLVNYQGSVARQVRLVFATNQDARVSMMMERRSPKLAAGYKRAIREGKIDQARRYLREAGFKVEELNPTILKQARTGAGASVPKDQKPLAVVNKAQLRTFIRAQQLKVGMAKAAWYQAAKDLVKRVRGNSRVGGVRKTYEKFPEIVRKLSRKFPGLGGAEVYGQGMQTRVVIFSEVKHAPDAAVESYFSAAREEAQTNLTDSVNFAMESLNKKLFG